MPFPRPRPHPRSRASHARTCRVHACPHARASAYTRPGLGTARPACVDTHAHIHARTHSRTHSPRVGRVTVCKPPPATVSPIDSLTRAMPPAASPSQHTHTHTHTQVRQIADSGDSGRPRPLADSDAAAERHALGARLHELEARRTAALGGLYHLLQRATGPGPGRPGPGVAGGDVPAARPSSAPLDAASLSRNPDGFDPGPAGPGWTQLPQVAAVAASRFAPVPRQAAPRVTTAAPSLSLAAPQTRAMAATSQFYRDTPLEARAAALS